MPQETQALVATEPPKVVKPRSKQHAAYLASRENAQSAVKALTKVQPILAALRKVYANAQSGPGPTYVRGGSPVTTATMAEAVQWLNAIREDVNATAALGGATFSGLSGYLKGLLTAFTIGVGDQGERIVNKAELRIIRKLIVRALRVSKRQINYELAYLRASASAPANEITIEVTGFVTPNTLRRARTQLDELETAMVARHEKRRAAKATFGNEVAS